MKDTAVLLIDCPDRKGLVAGVAGLLYRYGANITHADQHQDHEAGLFFMRVEWALDGFDLAAFQESFAGPRPRLQMRWRAEIHAGSAASSDFRVPISPLPGRPAAPPSDRRARCTIPLVISNHPDGEALARFYGAGFRHVPVSRETRREAEPEQRRLLREKPSTWWCWRAICRSCRRSSSRRIRRGSSMCTIRFCRRSWGRGRIMRRSTRGVKLIGATSHYVTAELDEGPIIEQDVVRISHRDQVEDLIEKGPGPGACGALPRRAVASGAPHSLLWKEDRGVRLSAGDVKLRKNAGCDGSWRSGFT